MTKGKIEALLEIINSRLDEITRVQSVQRELTKQLQNALLNIEDFRQKTINIPQPKLLTADQVGEQVGVSGATIRRWTREGHIPGHRITGSKRYMYDANEVTEALKK